MTRSVDRSLRPRSAEPATPGDPEAARARMEWFVRIWGTSLILLGIFALLNPLFSDQIPVMFVPIWGVSAIGLGLASFWLKHPALLATYAVFLGTQGLLMGIGWFMQGGGDTLVLAVGIVLLIYGVRLWGEFRRARHVPAGPADAFATGAITAALVAPVIGGTALAIRGPLLDLVVYWPYLALLALGLGLGALFTRTERPGIAKIGVGLSLLVLIGFVAVAVLFGGQ